MIPVYEVLCISSTDSILYSHFFVISKFVSLFTSKEYMYVVFEEDIAVILIFQNHEYYVYSESISLFDGTK